MTDPTATPPLPPRQDAAVRPLETPAGVDAGTEAPEGATGAQEGAQRLERMTADTATDDGLDWLYDRLESWRTAAGTSMRLVDELRAERDALAAGVPLVCSDERHTTRVFALRMALDRAEAERDRARRIAVALERKFAAVTALHYAVSAVDHGSACDACDLPWPCDTARALNPQEDQ